jgi:predicted RNA-binding Zn-ribbon protein involved in translation (DUF1610 family)
MTRIRATCPDCGNVEFGVHSIVVVGKPTATASTVDSFDSFGRSSTVYRFSCPECDRPVHRSAERDIIDLLISVGVPVEEPALMTEHLNPAVAALPAFTHADVDSFRHGLSQPGWFDELLKMTPIDKNTGEDGTER